MGKTKWIRCEERLPELKYGEFKDKSAGWLASDDVIGLLEDGTIKMVFYQSATTNGNLPGWFSDDGDESVVAWCQAPYQLD